MRSHTQKQWLWFVIYAVITLGTCLFVKFGIPKKTAGLYQDLMLRTLLLTCFLLMTGVYFWKRIKEDQHKWTAILLIFGFFMTTAFVILFRNTYYGYNGHFGDAEFIIASITKYAHYWTWGDFSYQDLSAFYPPLYFYLLGKLAWLLHIEPYQMVRYGFWAVVFLLPWLMVIAWSRLVDRSFAVLLTMTSMLLFFEEMIYKPYEFLTMVMIIPWWFTFVEPQSPLPQEKRAYRKFVLLGGFLGSLIFQTYYYWFFAFAIYWLAGLIWQWLQEGTIRPILPQYKHSFYVLLSMLMFSMLYIGPLLWNAVQYGMEPLQNKWFRAHMLKVPDFPLDSLPSVLFLLGFAGLIYFRQQKQLVKKILFLVTSCYAWQWIGHLGIAAKKPNLHFKMFDFLLFLLVIGFCYLIVHWEQKAKGRIWIAAVLTLFLTLGQQVVEFQKSIYYQRAFTSYIPAEVKYLKQWNPKGKVILSTDTKFTVYLPVYDFFTPIMYYSHHSSRREERIAFLQELSHHKNPAFVAWMLTYNKFDKVDYIYLKNFTLKTIHDRFPYTSELGWIKIRFAPEVFSSKFFIDRGKGFYEVRPISKDAYRTFDKEEMKLVKKYADEAVLKP